MMALRPGLFWGEGMSRGGESCRRSFECRRSKYLNAQFSNFYSYYRNAKQNEGFCQY